MRCCGTELAVCGLKLLLLPALALLLKEDIW
jgi:hypothetical protein